MPRKTRTLKEMKKEVINEFVTYWQTKDDNDLDEITDNFCARIEHRLDIRHKLARSKIEFFVEEAKKNHDIIILRNVIVMTGLEFPWIDYDYSDDLSDRKKSWASLISKLGENISTFTNKLMSAPLNLWMGSPLENRERSTKYDEHESPFVFGFKPSTPVKASSSTLATSANLTPFSSKYNSVLTKAKKKVKVKNIDELILEKILDKKDFDDMTKAGEEHYEKLKKKAHDDGDQFLENYWRDRKYEYWSKRTGNTIYIF